MMKIYCQRDLRWARYRLGSSGLTVGRFGCTTTCLAMIETYFRPNNAMNMNPGQIAGHGSWYTQGGLLIWGRLLIPGMRFVKRIHGRDDYAIRAALNDPDQAIILQVNDGAHWVVALRRTLFGNSYLVADPWDGIRVDVIRRYGNITGAAIFERA